MKILKNKTAAITITLIFIFSLTASAANVPNAFAATPTVNYPTISFINVAPSPCGVGQRVTVNFWLAIPIPDFEVAVNMTVVVTNPSGTSTTLGQFSSDETGGTTTYFTPTTTGNYTFEFFYGGQYLTPAIAASVGLIGTFYMEPSHSVKTTLSVTTTPATGIPLTPLPASWWQTPVNAENVQNWYTITGPWLGTYPAPFAYTGDYNETGNYNPYTTGPTTSHILWTEPWCIGGVAGGDAGGTELSNYWTTSQYQPKWDPVCIDGMLYATHYTTDTYYSNGIVAWNLYNGQLEFTINTTNPLICGWQPSWESVDQYGVVGPYLITAGSVPGITNPPNSGEYNLYDAMTGTFVCSIVGGPSSLPGYGFDTGALVTDPNGDLMGYYINYTTGYQLVQPGRTWAGLTTVNQYDSTPTLVEWNMTDALEEAALPFPGEIDWTIAPTFTFGPAGVSMGAYQYDEGVEYAVPIPTTFDGALIGTNNTSVPDDNGYNGLTYGNTFTGGIGSNVIVATYGDSTTLAPSVGETAGWLIEAGFNQYTGALLWIYNRTETPFTRLSENFFTLAGDGNYVDLNQATDVVTAYNIQTGAERWTATLTAGGATPNPYDDYGIQDLINTQAGVIFFWGLGGDIWAVNETNGNVIWWTSTTKLTGPSGIETPYGIWPLWVQFGGIACPGMLYLSEGHEYSPPLFHGAQYLAINMTNGQLLWKILAFADTAAEVSYGILTLFNSYDGQVYAFGKGPSETTVAALNPATTVGSTMIIAGSVMDISAGSQQEAVKANFPNGLPCVSDASMTQFMEAVYEQQPMPTNITGVPVTLSETDVTHNTYTIGTTTTSSAGTFGFDWTPPIPGNYTIVATFGGTASYYGSCAETYAYAGSAPATPAPTASPPTGLASTETVMLGVAAIIIVIVVCVAALAIIMLRKKP